MSFGFGVGDIITVLQLTQKIRKEFLDAPSHYQTITLEVDNVSHILQEVVDYIKANSISDVQQAKLHDICSSIRKVLNDTEKAISNYSSLQSGQSGVKGRAKRIWKRVQFQPQEFRDFRQRIISNLAVLSAFMVGLDRENITKLVKTQNQQEIKHILDWLAPRDYAAQQSNYLNRQLSGTGQWLLNSQDFQTWMNNDGCEGLLLQGIPGAGKTILTAMVIDHLQNLYNSNDSIALCYHFCDYKQYNDRVEEDNFQKDDQDLEQILLYLLRQLAETSLGIPPHVQSLYDKHQSSGTRMTLEDVKTALRCSFTLFNKVYIVIDALDECSATSGYRRDLLSEIARMSKFSGIKIMVTSRPLMDIVNGLQGFQINEIRASDEDISRYVECNIGKLPSFVAEDINIQNEMKSAITISADGIFLLATLHLQSLKGKRSRGALRKTLQSFGTGASAYAEAYNKTMERIASQIDDQKDLAMEALTWVVHAQRPLKANELLHALATDIDNLTFDPDNIPDIEAVVSACCGLIIVEPESDVVRLVHRTAQDFFQNSGCTWLRDAHTRLSKTCIAYLSFKDLNEDSSKFTNDSYKDKLTQYPLYDYASWYYRYHAELQEVPMPIEEFAPIQERVDATSQALVEFTVPAYSELCRQHPGVTGLHLLAQCGLTFAMPFFLRNHNINARDRRHQSPISYAVQEGHSDVVVLLREAGACLDGLYHMEDPYPIEFGFTPEHRIKDNDAQHLLLWSIKFNCFIAGLLINGGARLDIADIHGRNPLHWAVKERRDSLIRLLLEKGLDPCRTDTLNNMPIFYAIQWRYSAGTELLLTKSMIQNVDESGLNSLTLPFEISWKDKIELFAAAGSRDMLSTMSWLSQNGIRINETDVSGCTTLMHVSGRGAKDAIRFLLDNGANLHATDTQGRTALIYAVENRMKTAIELLLINGADVNTTDTFGDSALMYAVRNAEKDIVELSSNQDIDMNMVDRATYKSFFKAVRDGWEEVMKLLLRKGADVNAANAKGHTVLMQAVEKSLGSTVAFLLRAGADINMADLSGRTAIMYAVRNAEEKIAALLLRAGANMSITDKKGRTALMFAIERCREPTAFLFSISEVQCNQLDREGRSALFWAINEPLKERRIAWVTFLLINGADINTRCLMGKTPLDEAVIYGCETTVRMLLERGAGFEYSHKHRIPFVGGLSPWSPLHWASRNGSRELVKLLMDGGICSTTVSTSCPKAEWLPLDVAYFWDNTKSWPTNYISYFRDSSSGSLIPVRANKLHCYQNEELYTKCHNCSSARSTISHRKTYFCLMCKHQAAFAAELRNRARLTATFEP